MSDYEEFNRLDARLIILRELAKQTSGRLNETIITAALDMFGHNRSREWVRTELRKLEELGAVRIAEAGSVLVATITRSGIDHVERRSVIEGIARPSPVA
jgi:repressor of nif and glnA expression